MIDHVSLRVTDYERSKAFYSAALAPLGYSLLIESASGAGFRKEFIPDFWVKQGEPDRGTSQRANVPDGARGCGGSAIHVAFAANDRAAADAFYHAAIAAGGVSNGEPGLHPEYHANYYSAFVLDPDGYNIEAVCHKPLAQ